MPTVSAPAAPASTSGSALADPSTGTPRSARLDLLTRTAAGAWERRRVGSLEEARLALIGAGLPGGIVAAADTMSDALLSRIGPPSKLVVTASADAALAKANRPRRVAVVSQRRRPTAAPRVTASWNAPLLPAPYPPPFRDTPLDAIALTPGLRRQLSDLRTVGDLDALTEGDLMKARGSGTGAVARLRRILDEARERAEGPVPGSPDDDLLGLVEARLGRTGGFGMALLVRRLAGRNGLAIPRHEIAAEFGIAVGAILRHERMALDALDAETGILRRIEAALSELAERAPVPVRELLRQPWTRGLNQRAVMRLASSLGGLRADYASGGQALVQAQYLR